MLGPEHLEDVAVPGGRADPEAAPPTARTAAAAPEGLRLFEPHGVLLGPALVAQAHLRHAAEAGFAAGDGELEGHGPAVLLDHPDRPLAHMGQPLGELVQVAERGAEADDLHVPGQVDQHLLPGGAALFVVEEVDLIDDHAAEVGDLLAGEQHVPQDLGGHDPAGRVAADHQIAGDEAHLVLAQDPAVVAELLVGQGLDRRGEDDLFALAEGLLHQPVGDDGLAGAGRRRHEHALAPVEGGDGLGLKAVEHKAAVAQGLRGVGIGGGGLRGALGPHQVRAGGVVFSGHRQRVVDHVWVSVGQPVLQGRTV